MAQNDFGKMEDEYNFRLARKKFAIVRADGKSFSNLLKRFKPYDDEHYSSMVGATINTAKLMQNFVIAFTHSDEASFIMTDNIRPETQAWFDNRVQKISSVVAGSMSAHYTTYMSGCKKEWITGIFDARCFSLPVNESRVIAKYLLSRIFAGINNSIGSLYHHTYNTRKTVALALMETDLVEDGVLIPQWFKYGAIIVNRNGEWIEVSPKVVISDLISLVDQVMMNLIHKDDPVVVEETNIEVA